MVGQGFPAGTLDGKPLRPFSTDIAFFTILGVIVAMPGLVGILALRSFASDDNQWSDGPARQVSRVVEMRRYLRRLLAALGLLLTLLVVATAARRQTILSFKAGSNFAPESVILYGIMFAGILALFHLPAATEINRRCEKLLSIHAPIPSLDAPDISTPLTRRDDLATWLGMGESWRASFESGVLVFAPLLTALLGVALSTKST